MIEMGENEFRRELYLSSLFYTADFFKINDSDSILN